MNLQHERLLSLCDTLSLPFIAQGYAGASQEAAEKEMAYSDFLEGLLRTEAAGRQVRKQSMMTRLAGFPAIKTLDDFDYPFATGVKKSQIDELAGVGLIESTQDSKGKVSIERRYFIVSAGVKTVEQFADAARAHWGVEAMHWVLDVTFREDDCRVRKGHAAQNLSAIRKFALSALRTDTQHPTISLRRRRRLADSPTVARTIGQHFSASSFSKQARLRFHDVYVCDCRGESKCSSLPLSTVPYITGFRVKPRMLKLLSSKRLSITAR